MFEQQPYALTQAGEQQQKDVISSLISTRRVERHEYEHNECRAEFGIEEALLRVARRGGEGVKRRSKQLGTNAFNNNGGADVSTAQHYPMHMHTRAFGDERPLDSSGLSIE